MGSWPAGGISPHTHWLLRQPGWQTLVDPFTWFTHFLTEQDGSPSNSSQVASQGLGGLLPQQDRASLAMSWTFTAEQSSVQISGLSMMPSQSSSMPLPQISWSPDLQPV